MIEVNVNVRLSASPELSELLKGIFAGAVNSAPVAAAVEPEKKTRTRTAPAKEVEAATETPEPAAEIAPAETAAPEQEEAITVEALRAVVQAYSTQGKEQRENVKALLLTYNCSRIADIPADKRNEFKAKIEEL